MPRGKGEQGEISLRTNLGAAIFPFASELWGRTIIVNGVDENYDRYNAASTDKDKGVPQVFYMHNCMPILSGFQSVGYEQLIPAQTSATTFDQIFTLTGTGGYSYLFSPCGVTPAIYDSKQMEWFNPTVSPALPTSYVPAVSVATVNGQSYIYYSGIGCYEYVPATPELLGVTLTSLTPANILGISAASGYMLAYTSTGVYWSSTTTPTDFTPSVQTGAGGGNIQQIKGQIVAVYPISGGFLIYCTQNIVAAAYTGNIQFPFTFTEVPGSAGINFGYQTSWRSNTSPHYAFTSAGLMEINLNACALTNEEIADFISSCIFEDFDPNTLTFTSQILTQQVYTKLNYISERYLVVSYGVSQGNYTHAIVYDNFLGRYGKLKINHVDCFDYVSPSIQGTYEYESFVNIPYNAMTGSYGAYAGNPTNVSTNFVYKKTFAFLQSSGAVYNVNFDINSYDNLLGNNSVFVLGKYQYIRENFITHQKTEVETIYNGATFETYLLQSLNGKDISATTEMTLASQGNKVVNYALRQTGKNVSLMFIGSFNLTSVITYFTIAGKR